jgi:hypothetical protein
MGRGRSPVPVAVETGLSLPKRKGPNNQRVVGPKGGPLAANNASGDQQNTPPAIALKAALAGGRITLDLGLQADDDNSL